MLLLDLLEHVIFGLLDAHFDLKLEIFFTVATLNRLILDHHFLDLPWLLISLYRLTFTMLKNKLCDLSDVGRGGLLSLGTHETPSWNSILGNIIQSVVEALDMLLKIPVEQGSNSLDRAGTVIYELTSRTFLVVVAVAATGKTLGHILVPE